MANVAANTHLSVAAINAGLNAALDALNGGFFDIYSGVQPASPDVAVTNQVKLARLPLSATAFAAASGGNKAAGPVANGTGLAAGTATWMRAYKADGTTAVIDGSAGASGTDLVMQDPDITVGGTVQVTSWTVAWAQ